MHTSLSAAAVAILLSFASSACFAKEPETQPASSQPEFIVGPVRQQTLAEFTYFFKSTFEGFESPNNVVHVSCGTK